MNYPTEEEIISLDIENIDLDDKKAIKELLQKLLNIIEIRAQVILRQSAIIQQQGDEIARLKGAKGKPKIAPNVPPREPKHASTEKPKNWSKGSKNSKYQATD